MITKTIHSVHRVFPFIFTLLCVIAILVSPYKAFADTTYTMFTKASSGGSATDIQTVNSVDLFSNGDFHVSHGAEISKVGVVNVASSTVTWDSGPDFDLYYTWGFGGGVTKYYQPGPGFGGGPTYNLITELNGTGSSASQLNSPAPSGDYVLWYTSGNQANVVSYCFFGWDGTGVDLSHCGTPPGGGGGDPCDSGDTRICGFTPENGTTVTGPDVTFTFDAWLAAQDLDNNDRIKVQLHNIDQNVLLLGGLSNNDIYIIDRTFIPGEDGHYSYSTTTPLADGNYRLEAWIEKRIFFGWIKDPFGNNVDQVVSKQFIVGQPTFIGNLSQNGFNILNGVAASSTATSSLALVKQCNPLGDFDMTNCLFGLFIPDSNQVNSTIQGMRDGILTRLPWGYFTRFVTIMSSTATTTLPSFTVEFAQNTASDTTTLAFNPGDMLAGGGALVDSIRDPYNNKSLRDIFEPIVKLMVALMVLFTIVADLTGSHNHEGANSPGDVASKRRRT